MAEKARKKATKKAAGKRVVRPSLAEAHPHLAKEADGWDAKTVTPSSAKRMPWKCKKGHRWEAVVYARSRGQNCPYCSGQRILPGFNDLLSTHPLLAKEANGWDATTVQKGTNKKVSWKCSKNHVWDASISNRAIIGHGCPICSGSKVVAGVNDLATLFPKIAKEADGWDATLVGRGTRGSRPWKCEKGHKWNTAVANRTTSGTGCPYCIGQKVQSGFNDLFTTHPELAKEADGWDAHTINAGSNKKLPWKCHLGHKWNAVVSSRTDGWGCPVCSNKIILAGFNDLKSINPSLAAEAFEWDATKFSPHSGAKKKWICALGHVWTARISDRAGGTGCPTCATFGYDPNSDAWLYLLRHDRWGLLQIGITNDLDRRLNSHRHLGWETLEIKGPMDGLLVREWERAILNTLHRSGAKFKAKEIAGRFSGYTESWIEESLKIKSIKELMDMVENDDKK